MLASGEKNKNKTCRPTPMHLEEFFEKHFLKNFSGTFIFEIARITVNTHTKIIGDNLNWGVEVKSMKFDEDECRFAGGLPGVFAIGICSK